MSRRQYPASQRQKEVARMPSTYFSRWWIWAIRGVLAILFGLLTFAVPTATFTILVILFGIWAVVDGITHLSIAFHAGVEHKGLHVTEGIIGLAAGLVAFFFPLTTGVALLYIVAAWAVLSGITRILLAFHLNDSATREWMVGLSGLLALLFGIVIFLYPIAGIVAVALWIGIYAIVAGVVFLGLALRMRAGHKRMLLSGI
ncbi:MAG TPA: HdeD family acid-resistance protein [Acidobacterium sp.]|nr:HdeD family acid-resistance protein [Acidobacterium sp.]